MIIQIVRDVSHCVWGYLTHASALCWWDSAILLYGVFVIAPEHKDGLYQIVFGNSSVLRCVYIYHV